MSYSLKKGDLVLAQCKIGLQREETENQGRFVRRRGDKVVCEFAHQRRTLYSFQVKKFNPIDPDQLQKDCKAEFGSVVESIREACKALLSPDKYGEIKIDEEELTVSLYYDGITVVPAAYRLESFGDICEVAGWEVIISCYEPPTRFRPPDVQEATVAVVRGDLAVARAVVETGLKNEVENYFDSVSVERMAKELANDACMM